MENRYIIYTKDLKYEEGITYIPTRNIPISYLRIVLSYFVHIVSLYHIYDIISYFPHEVCIFMHKIISTRI